ncbi:rab-GTPase-TBC domain-containing protein [Cercophora scortea]|uniref:Rab-GTPase-TBC domain-containing protein n=1 Tax=Cercophora scortea TaxID=314031 RepID=A0AAE0MK21_9PEZI|nr:rab-GTPase-TBC domain-containing protein [Cercophora scortea]
MTLRDLNQADKMPSPTKAGDLGAIPVPIPAPVPSLLPPSTMMGVGMNMGIGMGMGMGMAVQLHPPPPSPGATGTTASTGTTSTTTGTTSTTSTTTGNTYRGLRRFQSAHSLGAKAASQPSLISQQRFQQLQQQQQQNQNQQQPPLPLPPQQPQQRTIQRKHSFQIQPQHQQHQHRQHQQQPQQQPFEQPRQFSSQQQQPQQHQLPQLPQLPPPLPQQPPSLSPARRNATANRSPQRGRANSDAPIVQQLTTAMAVPSRRSVLNKRSIAADAMSLEKLFREGPPNGDVEGALASTRLKILDQGIKSDNDGMSSLRIYVWLILLNAPVLETDTYLALIHRGASPAYSKIRNDTFRTLTTDPLFRRRVSEASLIRLLNAVAWKLYDAREEKTKEQHRPTSSSRQSLPAGSSSSGSITGSRPGTGGNDSFASHPASSPVARHRARALTLTTEGSEPGLTAGEPGTYVQGMNVLAAPFLYAARSEAEAFVAFHQLLTKECPGYIRGAMDGVHKGLALVDKVLSIVDPKLNAYLESKNMKAEIYAFPSVLTLCACTPPLPEVLRLWDFLFAYGPHLNILCIVAQLLLIRTKIMESPSPNKLLRSFPALQADQIKRTTLAIINRIPDDVYADIIAHAQ